MSGTKSQKIGKGSIVQRGNSFHLVISKGKVNGKYRPKWSKMKATTMEEALDERDFIYTDRRRNVWTEPTKITFETYSAEFLRDLKRAVKAGARAENTYDWYESRLRIHINPVIGGLKLTEIKARDLQNLYYDLYEKSPTMAEAVYRILHAIWAAAVLDDDIDIKYNLAEKIKRPEKEKVEINTWTGKQITYFLQNAKGRRYYEFFLMGFGAGMRASEILGLEWTDIDHENMVINVRKAIRLNKAFDEKNLFRKKTKTVNSVRKIRMIPIISENLKAWKKAQTAEKLAAKPGTYFESNLIFTTKEGKPVCYNNIRENYWQRLIDQIKNEEHPLPYMKVHAMRHSCATWLYNEMGVPLEIIQDILGHSTGQITKEFYAHAGVEAQDEAMAKVNDRFKEAGL
jgi:integrase